MQDVLPSQQCAVTQSTSSIASWNGPDKSMSMQLGTTYSGLVDVARQSKLYCWHSVSKCIVAGIDCMGYRTANTGAACFHFAALLKKASVSNAEMAHFIPKTHLQQGANKAAKSHPSACELGSTVPAVAASCRIQLIVEAGGKKGNLTHRSQPAGVGVLQHLCSEQPEAAQQIDEDRS